MAKNADLLFVAVAVPHPKADIVVRISCWEEVHRKNTAVSFFTRVGRPLALGGRPAIRNNFDFHSAASRATEFGIVRCQPAKRTRGVSTCGGACKFFRR